MALTLISPAKPAAAVKASIKVLSSLNLALLSALFASDQTVRGHTSVIACVSGRDYGCDISEG